LNACPPGKKTHYPLYRRLDGLQVKKILFPLVLESQAAQTVVSHYTMFSQVPRATGYYKVTVGSGRYGH